jgi:uncharacterized protein (DUF2336 family)
MPHRPAVNDLQSVLAELPQDRRARVLQRITEAFVQIAAQLKDQHVDVFDEVICCLIAEIETQALSELGLRLAPMPNAPRNAIRQLAENADIKVAGPVLAQSERLSEPDLAAIASTRDQAHMLAISGRKRVEQTVTEVLVQRGNGDVMRRLAGNLGAVFSEAGYDILLQRAAGDAAMAEKVVQRADITPERLRAMIARASEAVRARLIGAAPPQRRAAVEKLIAKISEQVAATASNEDDYYAHTIARLKEAHGSVSEKDVIAFVGAQKTGEATAALSMICGVPPETIEQLMDQERLEPFLMMCKAANFHWATVRALLELRVRPGKTMQDFLTEACDDFNRLSPRVSQQALKFWQAKRAG